MTGTARPSGTAAALDRARARKQTRVAAATSRFERTKRFLDDHNARVAADAQARAELAQAAYAQTQEGKDKAWLDYSARVAREDPSWAESIDHSETDADHEAYMLRFYGIKSGSLLEPVIPGDNATATPPESKAAEDA